MIKRHVIYCDHCLDSVVEAGSNARERKPATVSHEICTNLENVRQLFSIHPANGIFMADHAMCSFLTRTFLLVRDAGKCPAHGPEFFVVVMVTLRLRNLNTTDDGNIDLRSFRKILHSRLGKLM